MRNGMRNAERGRRAVPRQSYQHDGPNSAHKATNKDYIILGNGLAVERRTAATYARALAIMDANPHVFAKLVEHLRRETDSGRHVGADEICTYLRGHDFVGIDGDVFKVNHDYTPVWAREIRKRYPDLAPYIELRKSRFDAFYAE